ncbi:MAG: type IX secretion system membrane protein PorP/SprF [Phaeodactylibacter sp.]|uniref:PorP/SprF family type IX secretion system membrane protein n=1 Tax=Phaeodactylibacter sp. TaxID=1940289 RepID=UPI0032F09CE5
MKQLLTILLVTFITGIGWSQQAAQYSMFMMNKFNWNPAYAGMENALVATGIYRSQWQGLPGNPVTQNIGVHLPVNIIRSGMGLTLENDELGARQRTTGTLSYNYQMELGRWGILSAGGSAGYAQRTLDGEALRTPGGDYSPSDGILIHNDDLLPVTAISGSTLTYGAGVYLLTERFEAGLAVRNITEPIAPISDALSMQLSRAFFFNAEGHFDLSSMISFHPAVLVRSDLAQTQTDVAALFHYNDNIIAGASFRGYNSNSIDAVAMILGFKLSDNITVGYAYDFTLSILNQVSNGSHEVMVSYNLNKTLGTGRPPKIIYNPRSL